MNCHEVRTPKIRNRIVDKYSFFIAKVVNKDSMNSRVLTKNFSLISIIKILDCLVGEDLAFSYFELKSGFGMRKSFLNYVNLCLKFGFIEKERRNEGNRSRVYYRLKEKGRILLDLFNHES